MGRIRASLSWIRSSKNRWTVVSAVCAAMVVAGVLVATGVFRSAPKAPVVAPRHPRPAPTTTVVAPRVTAPRVTAPPTTTPRPVSKPKPQLPPPTTAAAGPTITIPAIGVTASVVPEGIDQTPGDVGNLAVPTAAEKVAWWDGGPQPGQAGVAVLAGHRVENWAFWRLPDLQSGDAIDVVGMDGKTTHWSVSSIQQIGKADLPPSIWTSGGPSMLALVTCGGVFNYGTGHYNDNVIVWATPTPPATAPPATAATT